MTTLDITAGQPFGWQINFKDCSSIWPTLSLCEIRAQLRTNIDTDSLLIADLHDYMTLALVGDDIVATWVMNGQQTRAMYAKQWGRNKTGYVNIILSDVGAIDARAVVVPPFQIHGFDTTTTAYDSLPTPPGP